MFHIRSSNKKKGYERLIGAKLIDPVNSYLSLYSITHEISKSTILRQLVDGWYCKVRKSLTEQDLILKVIKKAKDEWGIRKVRNKPLHQSWSLFKIELKQELIKKGISNSIVKQIMEGLDDGTNQ